MYPRSRSLPAPSRAARSAATRPASSSAAAGGAHSGWYQLIATPQCAMPQSGSSAATAAKVWRASS